MKTAKIRFGQIRRGERFKYRRQEWKRTKGAFAIRVKDIGTGHSGWPFKLETMVTPLSRTEPKLKPLPGKVRKGVETDFTGLPMNPFDANSWSMR